MTDTGKATLELRVDRGEQTPRRFSLDDRYIEVVNVFDAWLAPDHRRFKVSAAPRRPFIVRNDLTSARRELTMFKPTGAFLFLHRGGIMAERKIVAVVGSRQAAAAGRHFLNDPGSGFAARRPDARRQPSCT